MSTTTRAPGIEELERDVRDLERLIAKLETSQAAKLCPLLRDLAAELQQLRGEPPDCRSNSCLYSAHKGGMRTNGTCRCDHCPACGRQYLPHLENPRHREWCALPEWIPHHHREGVRP